LFSIPLGLAGLADAWQAAAPVLHTPKGVVRGLEILAAVIWVIVAVAYFWQGLRQVLADLSDQVLGPFVPVCTISGMLLGVFLGRESLTAGRIVVAVFLVLTLLAGGWLTGQWMLGNITRDKVHPGYFLPTVAGGLVGAYAAAQVGLREIGVAVFWIGIVCWILLGSIILNRLFTRPRLPAALTPTMAIEIAPPVVAGIAYFALTGGAINSVSIGLGGYAVLMALVQLRFVPIYSKLSFSPAFWAFTFPYAAAAADALSWLGYKRPAGTVGYTLAIITAITIFIAAIAARTIVALSRRQFLQPGPSPSPPAAPPPAGPPPAAPPGQLRAPCLGAVAQPTILAYVCVEVEQVIDLGETRWRFHLSAAANLREHSATAGHGGQQHLDRVDHQGDAESSQLGGGERRANAGARGVEDYRQVDVVLDLLDLLGAVNRVDKECVRSGDSKLAAAIQD